MKKVAFSKKPQHNGFTLIELIVVLVVVAILGVYATFRFSGTQGYIEYTFQNRLISALRTLQTQAMQDTATGTVYRLNINTSLPAYGPPATISPFVDFSIPQLSSGDTDRDSDNDDANAISNENVGIVVSGLASDTNVSFLQFNGLGEPVSDDGSAVCAVSGCTIDFIGQNAARVCIEPLGYIHEGNCGSG